MSKKILEGTVLNNKADKTVTVLVERKVLHLLLIMINGQRYMIGML